MLPKLITPEYEIEIPSSKTTITIRPFLVKEEKILLTALESEDKDQIIKTIKQILSNCILTDVDINKLSFFDFEYIFLMIRGKSIGNVIELNLKHKCEHVNRVNINLDEIKIKFEDNHSDKIMITDDLGIKMKYPNISNLDTFSDVSSKNIFNIIMNSIEYVFDNNKIYDDFTSDELKAFIESMNSTQLKKIIEFFEHMPKLKHEVNTKCGKCGDMINHHIEGLQDFFI